MLAGKKALVTGGAVRIGRDIVKALAQEGCGVVIHYRNSADAAEALCREIRESGGEAWTTAGELADPDSTSSMFREALDSAGSLDILINNASLFNKETLRASTDESVQREFRVNLFAPMQLTRLLADAMNPGSTWGHVINLVDRRVTGHDYACMPYVMSKKALRDFTELSAAELAPRIRVNAVAPGAILPAVVAGEVAPNPEVTPEPGGTALLDDDCTPADISRAVLYLLKSNGITGQTIFVDGGQHIIAQGC